MENLKIEYLKLSDLKPNAKNPRKNDGAVQRVMKSITEFGFANPILVDDHNAIIAGHTRLKAAHKLGLKEVPTVKLSHLTPAQANALMIADNKLNELAEWDNDLLKDLLDTLPETLNVEAMGFGLDEIEKMFGVFEPKLPSEEGSFDIKSDFTIIVTCDNSDSQQELFIELRDRGFTVK